MKKNLLALAVLGTSVALLAGCTKTTEVTEETTGAVVEEVVAPVVEEVTGTVAPTTEEVVAPEATTEEAAK